MRNACGERSHGVLLKKRREVFVFKEVEEVPLDKEAGEEDFV